MYFHQMDDLIAKHLSLFENLHQNILHDAVNDDNKKDPTTNHPAQRK